MIDSPHTRKEKREKIVALCENAQDIMKDILEKHKNNKVTCLFLFTPLICIAFFSICLSQRLQQSMFFIAVKHNYGNSQQP